MAEKIRKAQILKGIDQDDLDAEIGDRNNLTTTNKTNIVEAINEVNRKMFKYVWVLTGSDNLNDLRYIGIYQTSATASATPANNYPVHAAGILRVYSSGISTATHIIQEYTRYNGNRTTYKRYYYNGTWSPWAELWDSNTFNPDQYVLQSALNTQLANYATQTYVDTEIQNISLTPGPAGTNGKTWLSGTAAPATTLGTIGDFYLNRTNWTVYEKTATTTWTSRGTIKGADGATGATGATGAPGTNGTNGTNGADGKTWLSGTAAPATTLGTIGDFYLNRTNWTVYEKTATTTWTSRGTIKGADGAPGPPGVAVSTVQVMPISNVGINVAPSTVKTIVNYQGVFTGTNYLNGTIEGQELHINTVGNSADFPVNIQVLHKDMTQASSMSIGGGKTYRFIWSMGMGRWVDVSN